MRKHTHCKAPSTLTKGIGTARHMPCSTRQEPAIKLLSPAMLAYIDSLLFLSLFVQTEVAMQPGGRANKFYKGRLHQYKTLDGPAMRALMEKRLKSWIDRFPCRRAAEGSARRSAIWPCDVAMRCRIATSHDISHHHIATSTMSHCDIACLTGAMGIMIEDNHMRMVFVACDIVCDIACDACMRCGVRCGCGVTCDVWGAMPWCD